MRYMLRHVIILPRVLALFNGLSLSRVVVSIVIMTDGAIAVYRLAFFSLICVSNIGRGGWVCPYQPGL